MNIVRVWLYKVTKEGFKHPSCKPSATNKIVTKDVRGDFVYYETSGEKPIQVTRRDANKWSEETGNKVETWRGYPAWMHDLGFRA